MDTSSRIMTQLVDLVSPGKFPPRWGFHDDHRHADKTEKYLPAIQQVRGELHQLLRGIEAAGLLGGRFLQLGAGEAGVPSHALWSTVFKGGGMTIDFNGIYVDRLVGKGSNTHDDWTRNLARQFAPFDFLFIDAGHTFEDVRMDHHDYGPLIRPGGIVAFHDACRRPGYEEVEVWKYLELLGDHVRRVGDEVGTAWIVQE